MKKIYFLILSLCLCFLFTVPAFAYIPSVRIQFTKLPSSECVVAFASTNENWNDFYDPENPNSYCDTEEFRYIYENVELPEGYQLLNEIFYFTGKSNTISGITYLSPFIVILYDKVNKTCYVSQSMRNPGITSTYFAATIKKGELQVKAKSRSKYNPAFWIFVTVAVSLGFETGFAFLFGFRRKSYLFMVAVSLFASLMEALCLFLASGFWALWLFLGLCVIFAIGKPFLFHKICSRDEGKGKKDVVTCSIGSSLVSGFVFFISVILLLFLILL